MIENDLKMSSIFSSSKYGENIFLELLLIIIFDINFQEDVKFLILKSWNRWIQDCFVKNPVYYFGWMPQAFYWNYDQHF